MVKPRPRIGSVNDGLEIGLLNACPCERAPNSFLCHEQEKAVMRTNIILAALFPISCRSRLALVYSTGCRSLEPAAP